MYVFLGFWFLFVIMLLILYNFVGPLCLKILYFWFFRLVSIFWIYVGFGFESIGISYVFCFGGICCLLFVDLDLSFSIIFIELIFFFVFLDYENILL